MRRRSPLDLKVKTALQRLATASLGKFDPFLDGRQLLHSGPVRTFPNDVLADHTHETRRPEMAHGFLFRDCVVLASDQFAIRKQMALPAHALPDIALTTAQVGDVRYFGLRWGRASSSPQPKSSSSPLSELRRRTTETAAVQFYFDHEAERDAWVRVHREAFRVESDQDAAVNERPSSPPDPDPPVALADASTIENGPRRRSGPCGIAISEPDTGPGPSQAAADDDDRTAVSAEVQYVHWAAHLVAPIRAEIDDFEMREAMRDFESWVCADDRDFGVIVFNTLVRVTPPGTQMDISTIVIADGGGGGADRSAQVSDQLCQQFDMLLRERSGSSQARYLILAPK